MTSTTSNGIKNIITFVVILLIISVLWGGAWYWIDAVIVASPSDTIIDAAPTNTIINAALRGQFGDKFGAINALFSGFAFAGIIFTLLLQRQDLTETRNAMSHERFDNTFFQLLNLHIDITQRLSARGYDGREAFTAFNEYLKKCDPDFHVFCALQKISREKVRHIIDSRTVDKTTYPEFDDADITNILESLQSGVSAFNNFLDTTETMHEEKIISAYTKSCIQYIDYFSHYFRNLYHVLKFIDESELISNTEKSNYSKFVRAQLSEVELVVIFYNSIAKIGLPGREDMELGYPKMGRLIQKFDTLQNMNPRSIIHPIHKNIFEKNNGKANDNVR
jgi:hypothetical protein